MPRGNERAVLNACRVLFGAELRLESDFLHYLQSGGLKTAFRARAKETHPDRFGGGDAALRQQKTRAFQDVRRAYEVVDSFLRQRDQGLWTPAESAPSSASASTSSARPRPAGKSPRPGASAPLPPRPLQFGAYLLHRGLISYRGLILALVWQRRQRPPIGEIARRWGWLSEEAVERICGQRGPYRPFGERAVALGLLSPFQVRTLLWYQRGRQKKLGQYFIEQGLLSPGEVERLVGQMRAHNARFAHGPDR